MLRNSKRKSFCPFILSALKTLIYVAFLLVLQTAICDMDYSYYYYYYVYHYYVGITIFW